MSERTRRSSEWSRIEPPIELAPEEVHVWRIGTTLPRERVTRLWSLLDADEEQRALALERGAGRDGFVVTRSMLRLVLSSYVGRTAGELGFRYGAYGKPHLESSRERDVRFSVTHSGAVSLVAVARGRELGVDIELSRSPRHALRIARRLFHPATAALLESLPEQDRRRAFLAAWTQHEAYMKAVGEGLFRCADPLRLIWPRSTATELVEEHAVGGATRIWSVCALDPAVGYAGTLVAEGAITRVRCLDGAVLLDSPLDPASPAP